MLIFLFLSFFIRSDDESDDDDFWNQLQDDDVVVEEHVQGNLYDKARFNLPVQRRLTLFPQVEKTVKYLRDRQNIEFIYEARNPTLIFLDSTDTIVDTIDISKMSQDEIIALLALRGFKDIDDQPLPKKSRNQTQGENNSTESHNENIQVNTAMPEREAEL